MSRRRKWVPRPPVGVPTLIKELTGVIEMLRRDEIDTALLVLRGIASSKDYERVVVPYEDERDSEAVFKALLAELKPKPKARSKRTARRVRS